MPTLIDTVRFGSFELNAQTGELVSMEIGDDSSHPQKTLLREQPFLILKMLIERQGAIVSREEIKRQLWPDGPPVADADRSINVAMVLLRRVLSDSAETPRYIETIARRGYRLVVPVEWHTPAPPKLAPRSRVSEEEPTIEGGPFSHTASNLSRQLLNKVAGLLRGYRTSVSVAVILLATVVAGLWAYFHHCVRFGKDDTIVRADLDNQTGDVAFGDGLNLALQIALGQTPSLTTLHDVKIRETERMLNIPVNTKFTGEAAMRVCVATHSRAALSGSVADEGNRFLILLQMRDCPTGAELARVSQAAVGRSDVVHALGIAVYKLRVRLGEPDASLEQFNKPLQEATSSSPEALHYLALAYSRQLTGDTSGALPYYELAVENDPQCALAYAGAGSAYFWNGDDEHGRPRLEKAFTLRDRLAAPQRFNIEDLWYGTALGQWDRAYPRLREWTQTFPQDVIARINYAFTLETLGRPDEQLVQAREAVRLLPSAPTYLDWITAAIRAQNLEEAKLAYQEAIRQWPEDPDLRVQAAMLGFVQNDDSQMEQQWGWARLHPRDGEPIMYFHSRIEAYRGRFRSSHTLFQQLVREVQRDGPSKDLAYYPVTEALLRVEVGKVTGSKLQLPEVSRLSQDLFARTYVALVLARAGRVDEASQSVEALNRDFPNQFEVQRYCLPVIRAAIQLSKGDPQAAVDVLRPMSQYDLAATRGFDYLYPAYLRGLAYLQLKRPDLAVLEFQKLVDHPGIVEGVVIGALAYVQLARAQTALGNTKRAVESYGKFLELWQGADEDIPILREVRIESTRLRKMSSR